ncbi:MAG: hypothetical protein QM783_07475 [Phycisphaerales bacterium]
MKLIAAALLGASASAVSAQINYANYFQFQSINAEAYIGGNPDIQNSGGIGPGLYIDSVTAVATVQTGPNFFVSSTSTTSLVADMQPGYISLAGTFAQTVGAFAGSGATRGRITCDISFELTSQYFYSFSGNFGAAPPSMPSDPVHRDVWITGPGGYSVAPGPFLFSGSIGPGVYTLHVDIDCRKPGQDTPGFNVLFEIPTIPAPGAAAVALGSLGWFGRRRR